MATSGSKYITATFVSIIVLLSWFMYSDHFDVEINLNDITCRGDYSEPCEVPYNITLIDLPYFYIRNSQSIELDFSPDVKDFYSCKKDGRMKASWRNDRKLAPCGIGWREFDWKTPLTSKYKYINKFYKNKKQEFKLVVFKFHPTDEIKWGGKITGEEFDPIFYGIEGISIEEIQDCKTTSENKVKRKRGICTKIILVGTLDENNTNQTSEKEIEYDCFKGTYIDIINTTICKTLAFKIDDKLINFNEVNWQCKRNEYKITCDSQHQSNLDGICQSGERCVIFDIRDLSRKEIGVSKTPAIKELKIK